VSGKGCGSIVKESESSGVARELKGARKSRGMLDRGRTSGDITQGLRVRVVVTVGINVDYHWEDASGVEGSSVHEDAELENPLNTVL